MCKIFVRYFTDLCFLYNYYWPQRSCGQGNIFTPVCHSFCSQGGCLPQCMLGYHTPWEQTHTPPGADTPIPQADTPQSRHPPGADPPRSRHPPPEQTPPNGAGTPPMEQAPPNGAGTPQWSRHPPGADERPVRILLECILVFQKATNLPLKLQFNKKAFQ